MKGKLFTIEGASGSGKDTLLHALQEKGYTILRGGPSQNHPENQKLNTSSKKILGNSKVSLKLMLEEPQEVATQIAETYARIVKSQLQEALEKKRSGETIFMNRSVLSLQVHLKMAEKNLQISEEVKILLQETQTEFLKNIDGLIVFESPITGVVKEGIAGLQEQEAELLMENITKIENIKTLILNANKLSVDEEVYNVLMFIS